MWTEMTNAFMQNSTRERLCIDISKNCLQSYWMASLVWRTDFFIIWFWLINRNAKRLVLFVVFFICVFYCMLTWYNFFARTPLWRKAAAEQTVQKNLQRRKSLKRGTNMSQVHYLNYFSQFCKNILDNSEFQFHSPGEIWATEKTMPKV